MHTKIFSATTIGINAYPVEVEVDLSYGMLQFYIVGLPDAAIKESKQRVLTALKNCGIRLPERKITVNLAPADLKKEGTLFDLPIALGVLHAAHLLEIQKQFLQETLILGELSLNGDIRPIKGALAIAFDALKLGKKRIILPLENAQEAALIQGIEVIGVETLIELIAYLRAEKTITPTQLSVQTTPSNNSFKIDFNQVKGQHQAKRALQIAAAGRHNVLFIGPPGSGKTMLAQCLPTIMPAMSFEEILETSKIYSICGKLRKQTPLILERPFRSPHHTISQAGLVGGGSHPKPGEISLAHNGILFLDELTEFKRTTLEVLRQPLEQKEVSIARAQQTVHFPASFILVAALNPCPCGFLTDKKRTCSCSRQQIERYLDKLSGPLLDRIDLQIHVSSIDYEQVKTSEQCASSHELSLEVQKAVALQQKRYGHATITNASISPSLIEEHCALTPAAEEIIKKAFKTLNLSMRGYHKILKVARTIADLAQEAIIDVHHIQEAIAYRSLDQTLERMKK